ncbi:MAG: hypothetical protein JWP89_6773 [Schlesneria sp.]|nr:hypothetical protein [Schlesneria sp.]
MPTLRIETRDFDVPYDHLNGVTNPTVSRRKCLKFAMTVGLSSLSPTFGRTRVGLTLAAYRAAAVRCAIEFGHAQLTRVPRFRRLDGTEQGNIAYWIGMTFVGIAADKVLGVSKLIHATQAHGVVKANPISRSLADLVGQDTNQAWHVLEAKGRQISPSAQKLLDWKTQAGTIIGVNGAGVATNSYCVGFLQNPCSVELVDPPPSTPSVRLVIPPEEFGQLYYQPFLDFIGVADTWVIRGGRSVLLRVIGVDPIDNDYIYVGLDEKIVDAARKTGRFPQRLPEFEDKDLYIATDGIAVMTSPGACDL